MVIEGLYEDMETDTAPQTLKNLATELPGPLMLLGGWGVYLTVNTSFKDEHGSDYLGSRDIDLGFHIDTSISAEGLAKTPYAQVIECLEKIGYIPSGAFRYLRLMQKLTGRTLTEEESKGIPVFDLFYLFVDLMIDQIHPDHGSVFKIKAMQEPLLLKAFRDGRYQEVEFDGLKIHVPDADVLLAMKLNSFPNRQKDEKAWKDACDIYALLWHSPRSVDDMLSTMVKEFPEKLKGAHDSFTDDIVSKASRHLGIDEEAYIRTKDQLKPRR